MKLFKRRRAGVSVALSEDNVQVANATEQFAAEIIAFWYTAFGVKEPEKKNPLGFSVTEKDDPEE